MEEKELKIEKCIMKMNNINAMTNNLIKNIHEKNRFGYEEHSDLIRMKDMQAEIISELESLIKKIKTHE